MRAFQIHFPRALRQSFTRAAKKAFPAETFAYCLGTKDSLGAVSITHLYYPEIILDEDGYGMEIPTNGEALAVNFASSLGTKVQASIHSHPYLEHQNTDDCSPSEVDWTGNDLPMGICSIVQYQGKLRARYRFWPCIKPINLTS